MRSLMFDLMTVDSFEKMPMSALHSCRGTLEAGQGADTLHVAHGGELHGLHRSAQLVEVERLQLERVDDDQLSLLDAICAVYDVRRVELEQRPVELDLGVFRCGKVHDLHADEQQRIRMVNDDGKSAVACPDEKHPGLLFLILEIHP